MQCPLCTKWDQEECTCIHDPSYKPRIDCTEKFTEDVCKPNSISTVRGIYFKLKTTKHSIKIFLNTFTHINGGGTLKITIMMLTKSNFILGYYGQCRVGRKGQEEVKRLFGYDVCFYEQLVNNKWLVRPCPPGTTFSLSSCCCLANRYANCPTSGKYFYSSYP